jgi:hypothetical protein
MLGRLNLTVDECLEEYKRLGAEVFAHPRKAHAHNRLWAGSKYDYRKFEDVIEGVVRRYKRPRPSNEEEGEFDADLGPWKLFKDPPLPLGQHYCRT